MPGWVEDPSLGNIMMDTYNGMQAAPGKALSNIAMADKIKQARYQEELNKQAVNAFTLPEAYVAPRRFTAADIANPTMLNAPLSTTGTSTNLTFTDPKALEAREKEREFMLRNARARIYNDPNQGPNALGMGRVAARGPGATAEERIQDQFYTTGRYPTAEERSAPTIHNVNIPGPNGEITTRSTTDNKTDLATGRPLTDFMTPGAGTAITSTGPTSQLPVNPIETEAVAKNNFNKLATEVMTRMARGEPPLTEAEARSAIQLRDSAFPSKIDLRPDPDTGRLTPFTVPQTALPTAGPSGYLLQMLKDIETGAHRQPPPVAAAPPAVDPLAAVAPAAPGQPPATAPAPPPPIVPGPASLGVSAGAPVSAGNVSEVVKRYTDSRAYDNMQQARQGYNSMISNMEFDTPAADLAIVIGAAKALDPPSVVRYEESRKVEDLQGPITKVEGVINFLKGGGRLGPEVRAQLWTMVNAKTERDMAELKALRENHAVQVKQRGGDPNVLPQLPDVVPVDVRKISTQKVDATGTGTGIVPNAPATATAAPPPRASGLPPPADRVIGQIYTSPGGGQMKWTATGWANP